MNSYESWKKQETKHSWMDFRAGWNEAKEEILKILNNNIRQKDLEEYNIDLTALKEIEKL